MKKISWIGYDAVNSLVIIIGAVYFTKWLIVDAGVSDSVVAAVVSGASIIFVIVAPRFGSALVNEKTAFKRLLTVTIIVGLLSICLGIPGLSSAPTSTMVVASIVIFFLLNVTYQLSLVAYNAYLPVIVPKQQVQRYSGFGECAGQLGSVVGLIIAISLLGSKWFSDSTVRLFLVVGPIALVLCFIAVLGMRDSHGSMPDVTNQERKPVVRILLSSTTRQGLFSTLILVIFLYNNAFVTLQVFASSYLSVTGGWDEKLIGIGILSTLIGAAIGGFIAACIRNRIPLGRQLIFGTLVFAISITVLALALTNVVFFGSLIGGGIGFGFLAAVARTCLVLLVPELPTGLKFGVYGAVARTAAIVGPAIWAIVLASSSALGDSMSRRFAMCSLAALIWVSFGVVLFSRLGRASTIANDGSRESI